jgi:hypothetical protein
LPRPDFIPLLFFDTVSNTFILYTIARSLKAAKCRDFVKKYQDFPKCLFVRHLLFAACFYAPCIVHYPGELLSVSLNSERLTRPIRVMFRVMVLPLTIRDWRGILFNLKFVDFVSFFYYL